MPIGIVVNPQQHPDLVIQKLATDVTQFWIGQSTGVRPSSVLICNQDSIQAQQLLKQCEKKGIIFSRIIHTSSIELVANLTAHDCGTGILPERVARLLYSKKLNKCVDFPTYSDQLCLIYRAESRSVKAVKTIVTMIKTCF